MALAFCEVERTALPVRGHDCVIVASTGSSRIPWSGGGGGGGVVDEYECFDSFTSSASPSLVQQL